MGVARHCEEIEFRHLRYFVAAAEHGSFRKAGAAIGIQESAVSRRIRDLEDRLGAALFNRHSGGVCLTFAGQRFPCRAYQIVRAVGDGAEDVAAIGPSGFKSTSTIAGVFEKARDGRAERGAQHARAALDRFVPLESGCHFAPDISWGRDK